MKKKQSSFLMALIIFILLALSGCEEKTVTSTPSFSTTSPSAPVTTAAPPPAPAIVESPLDVTAFSSEREEAITNIVIHFASAIAVDFNNPYNLQKNIDIFKNAGVSSHYIIDRAGIIHRLIPESRAAWHAGKGTWKNDEKFTNRMNHFSVGIELLGIGTKEEMSIYLSSAEYDRIDPSLIGFTAPQYRSLKTLVDDIAYRNSIPLDRNHVLGHDEYNSAKNDPGKLFDWKTLF